MKKSEPFAKCYFALMQSLGSRDLAVLWGLIEFTNDKKLLSNSYLAKAMGANERSIRNWKNKLVELGLLKVESGNGGRNKVAKMEVIYPKYWGKIDNKAIKEKKKSIKDIKEKVAKNKLKLGKSFPIKEKKTRNDIPTLARNNIPTHYPYEKISKEEHFTNRLDKETQGEAFAFSSEAKTQVLASNETLAQLPPKKSQVIETEVIEVIEDCKSLAKTKQDVITLKPKGDKKICFDLVRSIISDGYISKANKDLQNKSYFLFLNAGISTKEMASLAFDEIIKIARSRYGDKTVKYHEAFVEIQARYQRLDSWQALRSYYKLTREVFSIKWDLILSGFLKHKGISSERLSTGSYMFRDNNLCYIDDYIEHDIRYPIQSEEISETIFQYLHMKLTGKGYTIEPLIEAKLAR